MKLKAAAGLFLVFTRSLCAQWTDGFNRPDGPMGPDWQVLSGAFGVQGLMGRSTAFTNQWMRHTAAAAPYSTVVMSVDAHAVGTDLQYVALASGVGGASNLFVKVQGTGVFTNYAFYQGFNVGPWAGPGSGYFSLASPFSAARLTVTTTGNGDSVRLDIDTNFDGTPDQTYTASGLSTIAANFGTGLGIGGYNISAFDNWAVAPAGVQCYADCNGDGVLNLSDLGCFRTRQALGDPYADCNGDGVLNLSDFGCFTTKFALGCP
ncbi:MAG: EF-hand domain-containing protein [Phycisphaerales bacterium]|nr:EF-hand domain-containing protein [Phycisphaerales bacterium]